MKHNLSLTLGTKRRALKHLVAHNVQCPQVLLAGGILGLADTLLPVVDGLVGTRWCPPHSLISSLMLPHLPSLVACGARFLFLRPI